MIQVKEGVIFKEFNNSFIQLYKAVDEVWQNATTIVPTITSANDGKHMDHSLHYKNLAWDLRTHNLEVEQIDKILVGLQQTLGLGWDVIREADHIHVEYDPK